MLFSHESSQQSWRLDASSPRDMYARSVLGAIEQKTGARIQRESDTITVFADSQVVIDNVRQKLSRCEEAFVCFPSWPVKPNTNLADGS